MKKLLIITYYWPPAGGAGVYRWLKFSKYLRNFGWEPVIFTSEGGEYSVIDNSLLTDVPENITILKYPVWEPYTIYKKFIGQKKEEKINVGFLSENKKKRFSEKVSIWIRGNFFIPDARTFWIKPSAKYLIKYLTENPVDAIVSTGPPHSTHLIANRIKKKINIPWIADFRDPWTYIDFYDELMLTKIADWWHHKLEQRVLNNADKVVTISWDCARDLEELGAKNVAVITNGFDEEDIISESIEQDKKFSITHIGSLVKSRNPETFWKAIQELVSENTSLKNDLEIKLIGKVDYSVNETIDNYNIRPYVSFVKHMPHDAVMKEMQQSQVLLLLINNSQNAKGILPGKFFEYLSARRPILCIGLTESDISRILKGTNAGKAIAFEDKEELKNYILLLYKDYKTKGLQNTSGNINKYSRRELAGQFCDLLNKLLH